MQTVLNMATIDESLAELQVLREQVMILKEENRVLKERMAENFNDNLGSSDTRLTETMKFNAWLLQTIPFGMDIVDYQGNVLFQSPKMQEKFGNGIGKKCWEQYRTDKTQCTGCPLNAALAIGQTEVYESNGVVGGGVFEICHTAIIYEGKKAMLEIFHDITKRKDAEKALLKAKEKAEENNRLKSAFLQNISHEFRTPMNGIIGFSQLMIKPGITEAERCLYSNKVVDGCEKLLRMVNQIVEISELQHRKAPLIKSVVDANMLLTEVLCKFRPKANRKKINLQVNSFLDENQQYFLSDKVKLLRILEYLTDNAIKFTAEGLVKLTCHTNGNGSIVFSVEDTGIGIASEAQKPIFELFRQMETGDTRRYGGLGLGLPIAKAYADILGGQLELRSEIGKGTTFLCSVPYIPYKAKPEEISNTDNNIDWSGKTMIVADDEDLNFELIEEFVKDTKITLIHARNGREAVNFCTKGEPIHLILMDIKMPVMDGITATKLIKRLRAEIPIIAQTAYVQSGGMETFSINEFAGYITKPVNREELLNILRKNFEKLEMGAS